MAMKGKYDHAAIEKKWQDAWAASALYKTADDPKKPKTFVLDMFPYPSGEGLHVGHPKGYIATDIYSRHMRMRGHNVLHPMGWDAFGLPAENYAIKNKVHPRAAVEKNIATFKQQLAHIGFDYDWSREINTTDPEYYKWTQWIFLQLYKKGLAYQSNEPINWCPSCMTGLANEDLDGNVCERCGSVVEKKALPQWVLKITAYADRMLVDLDTLQWPEHIKEAQRNWIGRSQGAEIDFALTFKTYPKHDAWRDQDGKPASIKIFTTRPDTLCGATYMVLAPEHPWVRAVWDTPHDNVVENKAEVEAYVKQAAAKTEIERSAEGRAMTGVELKGIKAINPATKEEIPVYVADYVLWGYGTGAIMAVPAHDERDYAFAKLFSIPVREVVMPHIIDKNNPPVPGKPSKTRRNVHAVVRDPKTGLFLILRSQTFGWDTVVIGGIEEGESAEEAARREILEETGYTDLTYKGPLGGTVMAEYFAKHKDENRVSLTEGLYFELASDAKVERTDPDVGEVLWVPAGEFVPGVMVNAELPLWLERLRDQHAPYTGNGVLVNSGEFSGLATEEAKQKITEHAGGKMVTNYKLRDWVFSRQRYWGEPIPIIHCPEHGAVAVPADQLPVLLPDVESYAPSGTGESPLAAISEWVNTTCPTCSGPAKRETNTMPQWAGSSWYYLRFMDPHNAQALVAPDKEKYWAPVDVYVGGDHAVRHLIYARFWHKFLYDIGAVTTIEPFARLEFLGFILAEDGRKMSKRYGNVINPDDVVKEHGADAFRVYEMFMGPFENTIAWSAKNLVGSRRFIERIWKLESLVVDAPVEAIETELHKTIAKVSEDIEAFKFNTAVSQMMIFLNAVEGAKAIGRAQWETLLKLLAPFAPHITEELWQAGGFEGSVHTAAWPTPDATKLVASSTTIAVQVNGKVRGTIMVDLSASESEVLAAARTQVGKWLEGKVEQKALYVKGKIVTFVIA